MIGEMYELEDGVMVELTPETKEEKETLRNMKVLHKNNLIVYWGDTLELHIRGEYVGYTGLKMYLMTKKVKVVEPEG